jgi:biopolymer transport protein ExbB
MKAYIFVPILFIGMILSYIIYSYMLPDYIKKGGPLLILLMTMSFLAITFILERLITLKRAQGRGDIGSFMRNLRKHVDQGKYGDAIDSCRKQGGCLANVVGAGLERYQFLFSESQLPKDELLDETKRAIEEANALETPILERNLIALSTIASIATMVGLLGTTIGMIRSFKAMAKAGAPDATQLALGISEALVNTAGGLSLAILCIIMYNYFTNRVDSFNFVMDETTYEIMQQLQRKKGVGHGAS